MHIFEIQIAWNTDKAIQLRKGNTKLYEGKIEPQNN